MTGSLMLSSLPSSTATPTRIDRIDFRPTATRPRAPAGPVEISLEEHGIAAEDQKPGDVIANEVPFQVGYREDRPGCQPGRGARSADRVDPEPELVDVMEVVPIVRRRHVAVGVDQQTGRPHLGEIDLPPGCAAKDAAPNTDTIVRSPVPDQSSHSAILSSCSSCFILSILSRLLHGRFSDRNC